MNKVFIIFFFKGGDFFTASGRKRAVFGGLFGRNSNVKGLLEQPFYTFRFILISLYVCSHVSCGFQLSFSLRLNHADR